MKSGVIYFLVQKERDHRDDYTVRFFFTVFLVMVNSKLPTILAHALAMFCGFIGWYVSTSIAAVLSGAWKPDRIFDAMDALFSFIIFLLLGALLGFIFNKIGWKIGLSLASFVIIVWILVFLLHIFSSARTVFSEITSFEKIIRFVLYFLPELIGSCLGAYLGAKHRDRRMIKGNV